jgi:hypothetical protein
VVHPGSCCGSANLNLGHYDARAGREGLISELNNWNGPVAVIDGDLSDELPSYPVFNDSLLQAIARNSKAGFLCMRIRGDAEEEFDQACAAKRIAARLELSPANHTIRLTGAWSHGEENDDGCVDHVYRTLTDIGYSVDILDSTLTLVMADEIAS